MKPRHMLFTLIFTMSLFLNSCEKGAVRDLTLWVYKTKNDYSNNVALELSEDKSKITSFPGPSDIKFKWPLKLHQDFYLGGAFGGVNTGYLSLTKTEYSQYEISPGPDSLYKLLIDKDPFLEFYEYIDRHNVFANDGIDTVKLNQLIDNGELEKYFTRLK